MSGLEEFNNPMENQVQIDEVVKEQKSKRVKDQESKGVKEQKSKRSFMLTERQIEMIYLLKSKKQGIDLSEIVGFAIEEYYERNKE